MKIEAKDLRIGNLVDMGYSISKVESINIDGISFIQDHYQSNQFEEYTNIKGIPLTPEILEKAGFEKTEVDMGNEKQEGFYKKGLIILKNEDIYYAAPYGYTMGGDCNYLHQLQNLYFALTGQELNIEL